MSNKNKENFVLAKKWFEEKKLPWSGKRATVVAIYYSFPSNQNGSGGVGTNIVPQKIISWGSNSEPRVYISPFALKRRIRDYWIKKGEKVIFREDPVLIDENMKEAAEEGGINFIDYDLFGYMKDTGKGNAAKTRPGPITSWGAVSLEPLHSFVDFNTSIHSTKNSDKGGSIFNRYISKEFYFTSFYINPDMIGFDFADESSFNEKEIMERKTKRLKKFFEALPYAMQKDSGGPRDKPACVFLGVAIGNLAYPVIDKIIFKSIEIKDDKINLKEELPSNFYLLHVDKAFVNISKNTEKIDKVITKLITK